MLENKALIFYKLKANILLVIIWFLIVTVFFSHESVAVSFPLAVKVEAITKEGHSKPLNHAYVHIGGRFSTTDKKGIAFFEGLPAGQYQLFIRHPGYKLIEQDINLAPGPRQTIELSLSPISYINWHAIIQVADLEQPLPGAQIILQPTNNTASQSASVNVISGWQGDVRVPKLAVGEYELQISAPGFLPLNKKIDIIEPQAASIIDKPEVDGTAIDICREWGANCGKPAADAWCKAHDYGDSVSHEVKQDSPPSRIISSGKLCEEKHCDRIISIACAQKSIHFYMQQDFKTAALLLKIIDAQSERLIPDAKIQLAETWPNGLITKSHSDRRGMVKFNHLKVSNANMIDVDNQLDISRRWITAHVEAEGYHTKNVPVVLSDKAKTIIVKLDSLRPQKEVEPNDKLATAQEIHSGAPLHFSINKKADHDIFKIKLDQAVAQKITIGPDNALQVHLRLLDSSGKLLKERGTQVGENNTISQKLRSGTYYIEVSEWGDNNFNPDVAMTLTVVPESAVDPREPNDTLKSALPIQLYEQVSGLIWPLGDHDFFRLQVPQAGVLRLYETSHGLQRHARLLDHNGKLLAEQGVHADSNMDFQAQVQQAGVYYIEFMEWGNNNASLIPYRFRVDLLPNDNINDPPLKKEELSAARLLPLDSIFSSTLLPQGDIDIFRLNLPGAGILRVQSHGSLQRHIRIYNKEGKLQTEQGVQANQKNNLSWNVEASGIAYIAIGEWGNNNWSADAYTLNVWFEAADELDFLQRNDEFGQAVPLLADQIVRGTYLPRRDHDIFSIDVDFPSQINLSVFSEMQTHLRIFDAQHKLLQEKGVQGSNTAMLKSQLNAGTYYVMLGEWGDNSASASPYELKAEIVRAEPGETWPLADDPIRHLKNGVAQAFSIDQNNDRDRFLFDMEKPGVVTLVLSSPLQTMTRVFDDRSNKKLSETGRQANQLLKLPIKVKEATRLRIEITEWGNNNSSAEKSFIMLDTQGRSLEADAIQIKSNSEASKMIDFERHRIKWAAAPQRCEVDLNADGQIELVLNNEEKKTGRFPDMGWYIVAATCYGTQGQQAKQQFWVDTTESADRKGMLISINEPSNRRPVDKPVTLQVQAISFEAKRIARVEFYLDNQLINTDFEVPFTASVNWQNLSSELHSLKVIAYDSDGQKAEAKRKFKLSEYFSLTPEDGAVLSGKNIRISWTAPEFGASKVRYRPKGSKDWKVVTGESAYQRSVILSDLESNIVYEFQPLGDNEAGPVHRLTRVKGLAFGQQRYGANVRRDYDQKVGISVRNNSDENMMVRLECGKPEDPLLLVGFVGDGSEDEPFSLEPGEERQFMLGISAQDVNTPDHRFLVKIVSENGLNDEAEVSVRVRLPHIELLWQDQGIAEDGYSHRYRLRNVGDAITDLSVSSEHPDKVDISPTVQHGLLPSGSSMNFIVAPHFYDGFKAVETTLIAAGMDKQFKQKYEMKLKPGESARQIWLFPGIDPGKPGTDEADLIKRARQAENMNPSLINWSQRFNAEDLDNDSQNDRWSLKQGNVLWVGDDTDGNASIDFVHADIGDDGIFEYSAYLAQGRWHKTNLVEAWLEMGFTLPWNTNSYKEHDVDIIFNNVVIGRIRDSIPEGNYTYRIPPSALHFDETGMPVDNQVGIKSKHLRGGHYVVNSDFRFKFRLTATPVWTVASSEQEARQRVRENAGISTDSTDLSVASSGLKIIGPEQPAAGDDMLVEVPLRNLGAISPPETHVALFRSLPGGKREEINRVSVDYVPLNGNVLVNISFKAPGGKNTMMVIADPDNKLNDSDHNNNEAVFFLNVAGDNTPPELKIISPKDKLTETAIVKQGLLAVHLESQDDQGDSFVELSLDGGLWQELKLKNNKAVAELLLQPGKHQVQFKASDKSGNTSIKKLLLESQAVKPEISFLKPAAGSNISQRSTDILIKGSTDIALVGIRVNKGPWHKATLLTAGWSTRIPLSYGLQNIEVLAANKKGIVTLQNITVNCNKQAGKNDIWKESTASDQGLLWPANRPDLEIDLFEQQSGLLKQLTLKPSERAIKLIQEAERRQAYRDFAGAMNKYRESLLLMPNQKIEDRANRLEFYLQAIH